MPVIGDPLTIVAGMLREPFPVFLALCLTYQDLALCGNGRGYARLDGRRTCA